MCRTPALLIINLVAFIFIPINTSAQEEWFAQTSNTTSFLMGVSSLIQTTELLLDWETQFSGLLGAEVTTLIASELSAVTHSFRWDASNRSSGVYFYRLESGTLVETKKLILLR